MFSLTNTTALITGASRGIGLATAQALHRQGAQVILHGTNAVALEKAAAQLGNASIIVADLTQPDAADSLAEQTLKLAPHGLHILVNNAGITRDNLFIRQKPIQWDEVLQVNLTAAVRLTHALLPSMLKNKVPAGLTNYGARIVNVTSVVAHMGNPGQTNYVTAKAALTGFTKGLAKEVAKRNVTVNCVAPGFIETAMTSDLDAATRAAYLQNIPAGRFGTPEEVAAAIAFLCSPEAAYITGTTLHLNGGLYLP